MIRFRGILMPVLAIACAGALLSPAATAQPAGQHQIVTGTICRIDLPGGTFDLLTGVGHVVRSRRIHFAADVKVTARRASVGTSALALGSVCRVECDIAPSGPSATGVEVLQPAPGRTP